VRHATDKIKNGSHNTALRLLSLRQMNLSTSTPRTQTGVPTYLLVPDPDPQLPEPPVETLLQDLPFQSLSWENFERLCLRVIETEAIVEQCLEYGTRGQDQHGIDLLARNRTDGAVTVYQCKRVKMFGPANIEAAVKKFLSETWAATATNFVLCTSHDLRTTDCTEEIVRQQALLLEYKIESEVWNATRLSGKLKAFPDLVYDFFGASWLTAFCGTQHSALVKKRLSPPKVSSFRTRLSKFYRNIFEQNDPGIPAIASPVAPRIDLAKRFVLPDLVNNETTFAESPKVESTAFDLIYEQDSFELERRDRSRVTAGDRGIREVRYGIDEWLSGGKRSLVVGVAGSGKTTLLRFILLDLLTQEPKLAAIAKELGRNLPVWIPFAYWTNSLNRHPEASLPDVLRGWFHNWGEDSLFQLVEEAIEDERLLLIVDGLDEWVNEATGSLAFAQLQLFIDMRSLPAIAAARPYALNWLKLSGAWRTARVASLTARQRHDICNLWFELRAAASNEPANSASTQHQATSLISNLESSLDLDDLSRIPLFLMLLIALRFQGTTLPAGRFDSYEYLIRHMLRDHPQRKQSAAAIIPSEQLSDREIRSILARLAFEIQVKRTGDIISEEDFENLLFEVLTSFEGDGLGLSHTEARRIAKAFINIEEGSLGLLVPQGVRAFGFLHRSLQERLAATHCSEKPIEEQKRLVSAYAKDPQWRETLLHLCSLTSRGNDLSELLAALPQVPDNPYLRDDLENFKIEVAFSDFDLPVQEVKQIATLAIDIVELSTDLERRRRVLRYCLNGLQARRTREIVQPKLAIWSISRASWRANWPAHLQAWPADELTRRTCRRGLNDEDAPVIRAAARSMGSLFNNDETLANEIAELARTSRYLNQRAACLECLVSSWPAHEGTKDTIAKAMGTEVPLLLLVGLYGEARLGSIDQEDAVVALDLASDRIGSPIPYHWQDLLPKLLLEVGKQHPSLVKHACLYAAEHTRYWRAHDGPLVDADVAWSVLVNGFPSDPEVIALVAREITRDSPFTSLNRHDIWQTLAANFRGVSEICAAVDARIDKFNNVQMLEASFAALLSRSKAAKHKMLQLLGGPFPHWAVGALLEGWGIQDNEVCVALEKMALGEEARASEIAAFIPQILGEAEGKKRLLHLMQHPNGHRLDFIFSGLFRSPDNRCDESLLSLAIDAVQQKDNFLGQAGATLIGLCPHSPQVRNLALTDLRSRTPAVAQIAAAYACDQMIRSELSNIMTPLPRELREEIVTVLSRSAVMGEHAEAILKLWDYEVDSQIKTKASVGYHSHLARSTELPIAVEEELTRAASSYGPDHHERRQAAFCGITLLKKFNILFENKERIGDPTELFVPLERGFRSNSAFLSFVASHWKELKGIFGDDLAKRFTRFAGQDSTWRILLSVAHECPELSADADSALHTFKYLQSSPAGLRFQSRIRPRSSQLRISALEALNSPAASWMEFLPVDAASEILLDQYRDETLLRDLKDLHHQNQLAIGPILTLCLGWPESEPVQAVMLDLNAANQLVALYAFLSAAPIDRLVDKLPDQLGRAAFDSFWGRYIRRPLAARLLRDSELCTALFNDLLRDPSPARKCNYPLAIARAQGLSQPAREWVIAEYGRQLSLDSSEFAYDFVLGEIRPVASSLKEALQSQ